MPPQIQKLQHEVDAEIHAAVDAALIAPFPRIDSYARHVYSEHLKPTAKHFDSAPAPEGGDRTMADLINKCLQDEMQRDERIVLFGEDVADCSQHEYLEDKKLKGKGGVFKLTSGLQRTFGPDRVFNSPLAEANIVGRALGMATRGLKPVVEIQFFDYIWPAMHQLRNELPLIRWRSNDTFSCPAGDPRRHRRLSQRRRRLSLPVRREHLHPHPRHARGLSLQRARCRGPAAHRHPLR